MFSGLFTMLLLDATSFVLYITRDAGNLLTFFTSCYITVNLVFKEKRVTTIANCDTKKSVFLDGYHWQSKLI